MICDLAETYGILDYKGLSPALVVTLVFGLREDSRTKMKLSGQKLTFDQTVSVLSFDLLSLLWWSKTKDAQHGNNRPVSLYKKLTEENTNADLMSFETPEELLEYMNRKEE